MSDLAPYLAAVVAGLAGAVLAIGADRAGVIRLGADEWRCGGSHEERHTVPGVNGVSFETSNICDRWERR